MLKDNAQDIGLVILNYMTPDETIEMLQSVFSLYPEIRIIVVDNGSSDYVVRQLQEVIEHYPSVTLLKSRENLGFAQGNNIGIAALRTEGYSYIVCSNNDVLIPEFGVFEVLKRGCIEHGAAVVGPRIVNLTGQDQNPYLHIRPSKVAARNYYRRACWVPEVVFPVLKLWRYARQLTIRHHNKRTAESFVPDRPIFVYALHGSFIMFGPIFFEHYSGFDNKTFLYSEERIIAEMLYCRSLKALFMPSTCIIHKEDVTSDFVWKSRAERMMFKYRKQSIRYWYLNHFRKNSP